MRAPGRVRLIAVVGALLSGATLAACGETHLEHTGARAHEVTQLAQPSDPGAVVAQVGPYSITAATLDRFTRARLSGEPASERLVPPLFRACVAQLENEAAARSETALGSGRLRSECQTRYEKVRQAVLHSLITDDWLIGAAHELRVTTTGQDANADIQRRAQLANTAIRRLVTDRVKPATRAQIASYYQQHRLQYLTSASRDVRLARTKESTSAARVRAEIASGKSFASVVRQLPLRQADYSHEGLVLGLGPHTYGEPALNKAIFTANPGVLTGPISTWYGYFVFEVTKVRFEHVRPLAAVQAAIGRRLTATLRERRLAAFLKQWRASWTARTECRLGSVVPGCRQFNVSAPSNGHGPP